MQIKIVRVGYILLLIFLISCEEKYWPELDNKYEDLLVVAGMITNNPGPYTINLSLSTTVRSPKQIPLSGYELIITDDSGQEETLTENNAGEYSTSPSGIQGVIGRKYQLTINAPDGRTYKSEFEELMIPTGIESVYAEVEYREDLNYYHELAGYQFYLDTYHAENDSNYYFWQLEATYKYRSDFLIRFIFDHFTLSPFPKPDSLQICWKTDKIQKLFLYNTLDLSEPKITRFPLHYVTTETRELSIRYSLLVKQFSITEKAYNFWSSVKEQNVEQGALYTKQPYQIRGNLVNTENPDEPVLGYFLVAGVSEKRIYVGRPQTPVLMYYPVCVITDADIEGFGYIFWSDKSTWPLYVTENDEGVRALTHQACVDCRLKGGTIEMPDFWEN